MSAILGVQYEGLDDLFNEERPFEDVSAEYNIPGLGTMSIPILNTAYLLDGVAYFRPYIRAFIVFLLVLYNIRMFLSFIGHDAGVLAGKVGSASLKKED